MTLTVLLMFRYISYKSFIVYFSLYSTIHSLSCIILCIVTFFCFLFAENGLSIDGKNQGLKKEDNTNTRVTNAKGEREDNRSSDTLRANIPHKAHIENDGQVFRVGEFICNTLETQ